MNFDFSINALLQDVITRLDNKVVPRGGRILSDRSRENRKQLFHVIDKMGEASAKAQGLYGAITTGRKLELSDHILYIIKDGQANNGKGAMVGILKIGHKKLFVYDSQGVQHEMMPLCILDFYVHESRQRQGLGRRLFDSMIQYERVKPHHLAIDRPSHKFSMFLTKHYNLRAVISQVNNFVVFEGFFSSRPDIDNSRSRNGKPPIYKHPDEYRTPYQLNGLDNHPPLGMSYSRPSSGKMASRPPSGITNDGHLSGRMLNRPPSGRRDDRPSSGRMTSRPQSGQMGNRPPSGRNAQRLQNGSPISLVPVEQKDVVVDQELNINPRLLGDAGVVANLPPDHGNGGPVHLDLRNLSAVNKSSRGLGAGVTMYSRHNVTPPSSNDDKLRHPNFDRMQSDPPMLQRNGPPPGYAEMMNMHHNYQDRQGHLRVQAQSTASLPPVQPSSRNNTYSQPASRSRTAVAYDPPPIHPPASAQSYKNTSWTVHGVVPNHRTIASRHNMHSRLW